MIESVRGIILRTRPLTETSLVVHWLTPDFGRIARLQKARAATNRRFSAGWICFTSRIFRSRRSRSSDLHNLREVNLARNPQSDPRGHLEIAAGAYAANFIVQATETETPLPAIFGLFREF